MDLEMATKSVVIVCGVPGSGKTWACLQLRDKFYYLPHDEYQKNLAEAVAKTAALCDQPVITECPFGERILKEKLETMGHKVTPYFIVEHPSVVKVRYEKRENRPVSQATLTRATTIMNRAKEWNAFFGTSQEVLKRLRDYGTHN